MQGLNTIMCLDSLSIITGQGSGQTSSQGDHGGLEGFRVKYRWRGKQGDGVDTLASLSLVSKRGYRLHQTSQRTTGKSTWMQGCSSFMVPYMEKKNKRDRMMNTTKTKAHDHSLVT